MASICIPRNVSTWLNTSAPLNTTKHGERARFSGDNSIVERWRPNDDAWNCVCYTSHRLPLGKVWQTTLLKTTSRWYVGLAIGVTTTLPDRVPRVLHLYDAGPHEWNYRGNTLYHNRSRTQFQHIPSLDKLSTHQTVGLLICTNGQLHMYIDGHHSECIANGLPVHKPLFGAVHVCENCTMIKSEFLSGEDASFPPCEDGNEANPNDQTTASGISGPTAGEPGLPKLLSLKIHQQVGTHYKVFGTFLLDDKTGCHVNSIEEECFRKPERINIKILEEWLAGKGRPLSWETLIKTLIDSDLNAVANQIHETLTTERLL